MPDRFLKPSFKLLFLFTSHPEQPLYTHFRTVPPHGVVKTNPHCAAMCARVCVCVYIFLQQFPWENGIFPPHNSFLSKAKAFPSFRNTTPNNHLFLLSQHQRPIKVLVC